MIVSRSHEILAGNRVLSLWRITRMFYSLFSPEVLNSRFQTPLPLVIRTRDVAMAT